MSISEKASLGVLLLSPYSESWLSLTRIELLKSFSPSHKPMTWLHSVLEKRQEETMTDEGRLFASTNVSGCLEAPRWRNPSKMPRLYGLGTLS